MVNQKPKPTRTIWTATRVAFYTFLVSMLLFYVGIFAFDVESTIADYFLIPLGIIFVVSFITTFVLSIIHLTKYKEKGLAVTALVITSLFIFFGIIGSLSDPYNYIDSDENVTYVNDENLFAQSVDCQAPKVNLFTRCCIPDKDFPSMCEDEAIIFNEKINEAFDNEIMSTPKRVYYDDFSFVQPPDYVVIQDYKEGGLNVPYTFVAFGQDENGDTDYNKEIDISLMQFPASITNTPEWREMVRTGDGLEDFDSGFDAGLNKSKAYFSQFVDMEVADTTTRFIRTKEGYKAFVIEMQLDVEGENGMEEVYVKEVIILDNGLLLIYRSPMELSSYVSEFDDVVNSLRLQ